MDALGNDAVLKAGEERDREEEPVRGAHVRIRREIRVPQFTVKRAAVHEAAQRPRVEMSEARWPVASAPVIGIGAAHQWHRSKCARGAGQKLDLGRVKVVVDELANSWLQRSKIAWAQ